MTPSLKIDVAGVARRMRNEGVAYEEALRQFKRALIREILRAHEGHQQRAAMEMGAHRNTLSRTMNDLGLTCEGVRMELRSERKKQIRSAVMDGPIERVTGLKAAS